MKSNQRTGRDISIPFPMVQRLADLITADDDAKIVDTLRCMMLHASLSVRTRSSRESGTSYTEIPDWRARGWAAVQLAQIKHGKPTQQLKIDVTDSSHRPMSEAEMQRVMLEDWESIKEIGDQYAKAIRALPASASEIPAQSADAELVEIDLPN